MKIHRALKPLVSAFVLVMAAGPGAPRAADGSDAKPAGGARPPAKFAAKTATCREYLALAPNLRGLVVAWTAGRYYQSKATDSWMLDEASASKVLGAVDDECGKAPEASFRYKVVGAVKALKKR